MCYFLYGAINDGIHMADYEKLDHTDYEFLIGSEEDVIKSINKEDCKCRITHSHCDCGTPIGDGHENKKGLKKLQTISNLCRKFAALNTSIFVKSGLVTRSKNRKRYIFRMLTFCIFSPM